VTVQPDVAHWLADPVGGDAARRAAEQELRKAEYHRDDPGLIDRLLTWLGKRLDFLTSGSPGGSATLILLVLLAAVVIFAIARASSSRGLARAEKADSDLLASSSEIDHQRAAEQFAAGGNYAEALREWLRAAVQTAENRGVIDPRPGRTADEFAREAGMLMPTAAELITRAATTFDLVWFGGQPAGAAEAADGRAAALALRGARIERGSDVGAEARYSVPR
jgi:hypothetical protein